MNSSHKSLLEIKSPRLHSFFKKKHPTHLDFANLAFELAAKNDGIIEFGFNRKPDINFNPRPARIPLIADQFSNRFESDFYVASIVSAMPIDAIKSELSTIRLSFNEKIHKCISEFIDNEIIIRSGKEIPSNTIRFPYLSIFNFLDRLRHSHLAERTELDYCMYSFNSYFNLIPQDQTKLAIVFKTWHKRSRINLQKSTFK